jgi:hypothetical protein
LRRGRKSMDRHCGKVIEAKPTLGQISPSEAAWAPADRPGGDLATIWPLPTRGKQRSQRNQVCVRINGGKTAGRERQASSASSLRDRIGPPGRKLGMRAAVAFGQGRRSEILMSIFASPGRRPQDARDTSPSGPAAAATEPDGRWQSRQMARRADGNSRLEQRRVRVKDAELLSGPSGPLLLAAGFQRFASSSSTSAWHRSGAHQILLVNDIINVAAQGVMFMTIIYSMRDRNAGFAAPC